MLANILEEQRHTDRGDQHRQFRPRTQRPVGQLFNDDSQRGANDHRCQQDRRRRRDRVGRQNPVCLRRQVKSAKRSDHEHVSVRKVDEPEDAIHHGVAERDQRVDRAQRQAVDELLKEFDQAR